MLKQCTLLNSVAKIILGSEACSHNTSETVDVEKTSLNHTPVVVKLPSADNYLELLTLKKD